jgi:hypothetical protein
MFQQIYTIANLSEKNPVEIRFISGLRATLTHVSASAEGWLEIKLEKKEAGNAGEALENAAQPAPEILFNGRLPGGLRAYRREDFPEGQHPRILTGDELCLRLAGRAKSVCLALTFAEG